MDTAIVPKTRPVDAALRALKILKVFGQSSPELSLSEIAQRTGMAKSTTLRMLLSLAEEGFVAVNASKRYMLGPEVYRLGCCYADNFDLEQRIRPRMKALVRESGECVSFFQRLGDQRMCLFRENSQQVLREHVAEGHTVVLDRGAAGRVLVDFERVSPLEAGTMAMRASLPYISHGERNSEIGGLAAPVFSTLKGGLLGALAISGPVARLTPERIESMRPLIYSTAAELSALLGSRFYA